MLEMSTICTWLFDKNYDRLKTPNKDNEYLKDRLPTKWKLPILNFSAQSFNKVNSTLPKFQPSCGMEASDMDL